MKSLRRAAAATLLAVLALGAAAVRADEPKRDWREEKCFRYTRDWNEAVRRVGRDGVSAEFLAGNDAFVRSGCVAAGRICPTTAKDRKLADALALRVVNEGMSTTFLPFDCPKR